MIHKKVKFQDNIYWLHGDENDICYNISPLDHYSEDGEFLANPFSDISYAILLDGKILRYNEEIGAENDLEEINDNK